MTFYLDLLTIVSLGLLIGTEFAVSAFINPVLWQLEDQAQAFAVKSFANKLGTVMPPWYGANLLLLISEAVLRWHQPGAPWLVVSCGLWALVILLTIFFLVPINNRLSALDRHRFSSVEKQAHHSWDARHRLRVVTLVVALLLALSVLLGHGVVLR